MEPQVFRIPLTNVPQRFEIELGNNDVIIVSRYNNISKCWFLDILKSSDETPLIMNLQVVAGCDLLSQHKHIIDGAMVAVTDGDTHANPTYENIGAQANLYYVVS